jgi:methionine synthase I (cobalamin-dependent)
MGSMLIARGLETGRPPEAWNADRPDVIRSVHDAYLEAGAEVVETNTFGGTPGRLATHGLRDRVAELNQAGIRIAREAADARPPDPARFVALSMGPCGHMMPPVGSADDNDIRAEFTAQLVALDVGDVDLVIVETMLDVREARIALEVAKHLTNCPVAVSMTYTRNRRGFFTVMGDEASAATRALEEAGADMIAANCSIASRDMLDLAALLRDSTALPVLCQPNAGQPAVRDGLPVYEQSPEEFAEHASQLFAMGIDAVGGCCGTTPEFIRLTARAMGRPDA